MSYLSRCLLAILSILQAVRCTEVVMQIPAGGEAEEGATYRLDYTPPFGSPAPNTTIIAKELGQNIQFSGVLPGSKYEFRLYYTNSTLRDWPMYTAAITTAPDPPSSLNVSVINGTSALIKFAAPKRGEWTSFNLKVILILEDKLLRREVLITTEPYLLTDLIPGGTYQIQLSTVFDTKESISSKLYNFTTRPSPPTNLLVWFRNSTMLKILWQPPNETPIYSLYKVVIYPHDAPESVLFVEKGDPPGPGGAIFIDLVPGRAYNLSVQSVSEGVLSLPISAEYCTTPLKPVRLQVDPTSVTSSSFAVTWDPPDNLSEFDKYRVSINLQQPPVIRNKMEPRSVSYSERLEPGHTYKVSAMTVSRKVNSPEATVNVTLKPLPVRDVNAALIDPAGHVRVTWKPANASLQDSYEISYTEVYNGTVLNGDTNFMTSENTEYILESLLPGRNYSISVKAISNKVLSSPVITYQATRPSAPVIEELKPIEYGLNISWKSDVNSRQEKYEIRHRRNDTITNEYRINITKSTHLLIDNLYPGAVYVIRVYAISHGLKSEPHEYSQAVFPKPPTNLQRINFTSNSVTLSWEKPKDSLFSEFSVRFHTEGNMKWTKKSAKTTVIEVTDLVPGHCYFLKINTVSFGTESSRPLTLNHTVYPSPVSSIASLVDSTNVTVEFPRPAGRIDYYVINWITRENGNTQEKTMNVSTVGMKGDQVRILVDNLMPGLLYQFDIHSVSFDLHSNPTLFAARTMPLINSELVVVSHPQDTGTMIIHYTPTPLNISFFDKYQFNLSDSGLVVEKNATDPSREVVFSGLVPGKLYNITVWTVSEKVLSQPLHKEDRLYPDPVPKLLATHITDTLVTLVWGKPRGEFSSYEVQYLNTEGVLVQNLTKQESCTVDDLKPYRNYTFTVVVRSGTDNSNFLRRSLPVTASFQTQEGLPGKVRDFQATDVRPREISFVWSLPEGEWNGILLAFTILFGLEGSFDNDLKDFEPGESKGSIQDLIPGKTYIFKIQAKTKVGYGPDAVWKETMPIFAPPKPESQFVPTEVAHSTSTMQVRFRKNYFSEENGPIVNYTIIVAEDDKKNTSLIEMLSWFDVQGYSAWPPYQVMDPFCPFKNTTVFDYTIGSQDCRYILRGYCNGPLKGGTIYRVKIRAFTAPNKFTDTDYSFPIQTDTDHLPVILGVTAGIILFIGVVVSVVMLRKFKISLHCGKKEPKKKVTLSLSDCIIETSKPIKLDKFAAYYEIMSADSDFRFSEEYEQLKQVGRDQSCLQADLPCNRPKNRFTNILPYDHSRFKLQPVDDEEGSDYINANYIPGYNSPREFIVTQGPLPSTKDDFWRMCWESNARAIVMLTRCIEKGREKCDHYWPEDTKRVYYGDISVTILNESYYPNWTITELEIQRGESKRIIRHFHFIKWPDFGVPDPPTILVNFVRTFREKVTNEPRPIIVHCSAGVGRSGTFIAIDRIRESLKNGADSVDVFGVVYQMRKERVLMVQTEQQYICIYQCILSVVQNPDSSSRDDNQNKAYEDDEGIAVSGT